MTRDTASDDDARFIFQFFTEIGILNQLASAELRKALGRELGESEFGVLNHFVRVGDGVTPSDLARIFQVTKPSMSAILRKLSAKGYVAIAPSTDDARRKLVTLTPAGRRAHEGGVKATAPFAQRFIRETGVADMRDIYPALQRIGLWLDAARDLDD